MKIIYGTDFSVQASEAAAWAGRSNSPLKLVHALETAWLRLETWQGETL